MISLGIHCPNCMSTRLTTVETKRRDQSIRRRRKCFDCHGAFYTEEKVTEPLRKRRAAESNVR